jgi:hypothetical protein
MDRSQTREFFLSGIMLMLTLMFVMVTHTRTHACMHARSHTQLMGLKDNLKLCQGVRNSACCLAHDAVVLRDKLRSDLQH